MKLYACRGCGSAIIEGIFALLGIDVERREVGIFSEAPDELRRVNPLAQVPTLVLPDGTVMTESVAIALWALEQAGETPYAPSPGDPLRPTFLRWLVYLPAAIYPMYTVGDVPETWVGDDAAPGLKQATVARTLQCWQIMEEALAGYGAHALGDDLGVLDVFIAVISRWRPGREQIRRVAPRLMTAADRTEAHPALAALFAREFPPADPA